MAPQMAAEMDANFLLPVGDGVMQTLYAFFICYAKRQMHSPFAYLQPQGQ
jgi:hypothetical protein